MLKVINIQKLAKNQKKNFLVDNSFLKLKYRYI